MCTTEVLYEFIDNGRVVMAPEHGSYIGLFMHELFMKTAPLLGIWSTANDYLNYDRFSPLTNEEQMAEGRKPQQKMIYINL